MSFNESNTVEQMILKAVTELGRSQPPGIGEKSPGWGNSLGGELLHGNMCPPLKYRDS
jgi:hypothetical protein